MFRRGAEALSEAELLALIIRTADTVTAKVPLIWAGVVCPF
jgi:DNA repair protein RadC